MTKCKLKTYSTIESKSKYKNHNFIRVVSTYDYSKYHSLGGRVFQDYFKCEVCGYKIGD